MAARGSESKRAGLDRSAHGRRPSTAAAVAGIASACARRTSSTSAAPSLAPSPAAPTRSSGAKGELLANACRGTRKDIREAVRAARKAFPGWAGKTAYNRSQILYRIAELMEGRRDQFVAEVIAAEGISRGRAARKVDAAIDRWVWYAGWADKYPQLIGTVNPVAGSYFNFSVPEPTGVVGVIAPEASACSAW